MADQDVSGIWNTPGDPTSGLDNTALDTYLEKRLIYPLGAGEDIQTISMLTALGVMKDGVVFQYDATDTTSVHDGTNILVDADGRRYKSNLVAPVYSVLDILNTPPGSPSLGDSYLVDTSPTGQWSTDSAAKKVAIWTHWEWVYVSPVKGMSLYVTDETGFYHYNASGSWEAGSGAYSFGAGTVLPSYLKFPGGLVAEDEANDPSALSPSTGQMWIIGTSPVGDWSGKAGQLAYYNGSGWTYLTPAEGWEVYDKDGGTSPEKRRYTGSAWVSTSSGKVVYHKYVQRITNQNIDQTAYPATVSDDSDGILLATRSADSASNVYRITIHGLEFTESDTVFIAAMLDAETSARTNLLTNQTAVISGTSTEGYIGQVTFIIAIPDTSSHSVYLKFRTSSASVGDDFDCTGFELEEVQSA